MINERVMGMFASEICLVSSMATASRSTTAAPKILLPISEHSLYLMLNQVIQEMKQMREEFRKNLSKVQEEQKCMGTALPLELPCRALVCTQVV